MSTNWCAQALQLRAVRLMTELCGFVAVFANDRTRNEQGAGIDLTDETLHLDEGHGFFKFRRCLV